MQAPWTRREILQASAVLGIGTALGLQGCGAAGPAGVYAVDDVLIPLVAAIPFQELWAFAKANFGRLFEAGDTISATPQGVALFEKNPGPICGLFKATEVDNKFCTPISAIQKGTNRLLQLAEEGKPWSLLTGGQSNESVFRIHETWLSWLLQKDNCNLRVNGHSFYGECGVDKCPVYVTKQSFLKVDGSNLDLEIPVGKDYPADALENHNTHHVKEFLGCPRVEGNPDQCVA